MYVRSNLTSVNMSEGVCMVRSNQISVNMSGGWGEVTVLGEELGGEVPCDL